MLLVKPYGLTVSSSDALVSCPASPLGTPCKRFIFTIRDSFWNIVRFHYFQGFGSPLLAKPLFTVSILPLFHRSAHFGACGCDGLRRSTLRSGLGYRYAIQGLMVCIRYTLFGCSGFSARTPCFGVSNSVGGLQHFRRHSYRALLQRILTPSTPCQWLPHGASFSLTVQRFPALGFPIQHTLFSRCRVSPPGLHKGFRLHRVFGLSVAP